MSLLPERDTSWYYEDDLRAESLEHVKHAEHCACDDCLEVRALRGLPPIPRIENDDYRIGEGTFEEHFHHVVRYERTSEAS